MIEDRNTCARMFLYRNRLGLKSREFSEAMNIGSVFHEVMEYVCHSGHVDPKTQVTDALGRVRSNYQERVIELRRKTDRAGLLPWGEPLTQRLRVMEKAWRVGEAVASWAYLKDPIDRKRWKVLAVEQAAEIPGSVLDPQIKSPLRVKADLILQHRESGQVWFVDWKTTGWDLSKVLLSLRWNPQTRLYRLVLSAGGWPGLPKGARVNGVFHKVVRVPGIRIKDKETLEEYVDRVHEDYAQKEHQGVRTYATSSIAFNSEPLTPEFRNTLREISRDLRKLARPESYPRNASACFRYNRPCAYMDLCANPSALWKELAGRRFEVVDPAYRPGEQLVQSNPNPNRKDNPCPTNS
jgi:hypothetical protein